MQLIDALLTLATSEGGVERWEPCDLGQIAETVIVGRREARRRDIREWLDGRLAERGLKNPLDGELSWRVLDYRGETSSRRSTA